jgi:hypothetical protein
LLLREGSNGKARVQAIAKGPFLALPAPVNGKVLRQDPRVIVQLVNDAPAPLCWETRFSQPATRNTLVQFKDKSD